MADSKSFNLTVYSNTKNRAHQEVIKEIAANPDTMATLLACSSADKDNYVAGMVREAFFKVLKDDGDFDMTMQEVRHWLAANLDLKDGPYFGIASNCTVTVTIND